VYQQIWKPNCSSSIKDKARDLKRGKLDVKTKESHHMNLHGCRFFLCHGPRPEVHNWWPSIKVHAAMHMQFKM